MRQSLKKTMVLVFLPTASFSLSFSAIKKRSIYGQRARYPTASGIF